MYKCWSSQVAPSQREVKNRNLTCSSSVNTSPAKRKCSDPLRCQVQEIYQGKSYEGYRGESSRSHHAPAGVTQSVTWVNRGTKEEWARFQTAPHF